MSDPKPQTNLYTVGGAVQAGGGLYLPRRADNELLELCRAGAFSYVLTPRQLGKTSLMVRTAERLGEEGVRSVIIDLTQIGVQVTVENWYLGLLAVIEDQLMLQTSAVEWWKARGDEGMTQRLVEFFKDVALKEVEGRLVVFVDEIDTTLSLPFTDDFYAAVRYFYNARAHTPELKRLSFVLIGVATPGDLVRDPQRTPFNIGHRVDLTDFTFDEALPLAAGLGLPLEESRRVLAWVLEWTGGHPYLTQRLCRAVAEERRENWTREDVERLTASVFFGEMSEKDNNLQFVRDMLTKRAPDLAGVLATYREVLRGRRPVPDEEQSIVKSHLKLSGIAYRKQGTLHVRNPIYAKVFDRHWIAQHLPVNWTKRLQRIAAALALLVLVGLIPLSLYAFAKKNAAEEQAKVAVEQSMLAKEEAVRAEAERGKALLAREDAEEQRRNAEAARVQEREAKEEAEKQREMAVAAAKEAKTAQAEADKQRQIAVEQRARAEEEAKRATELAAAARASEQVAQVSRDEAETARKKAESLRQLAVGGQLGAVAEVTRNQQANLLQRSVVIARESILQSPEAPPVIGYQALSQGLALLPPLKTAFQTEGSDTKTAFVAGNKYLLTVSEDGKAAATERRYNVKVFDVAAGYKPVDSLALSEPMNDSSFSPDLTHLATRRGDRTLSVVKLASGVEPKSFMIPTGIGQFAISNDGKYAATVDSDGLTVRVRDLAADREVSSWKETEGPVFDLGFSPAGNYLQMRRNRTETRSGPIWTVALRAVADGREINQMKGGRRSVGPPGPYDGYSFSGDDGLVAFQGESGVEVRRASEFEKPVSKFNHPGDVKLIVFDPLSQQLMTTGVDNVLRIWGEPISSESINSEPIASIRYDGVVTNIVFDPDTGRIAATSADGTARVWDRLYRMAEEVTRVIHPNVVDVDFGPGGALVTADSSGYVRVWGAESNDDFIQKTITELIVKPFLTPDGRYLADLGAAGRSSGVLAVWDMADPLLRPAGPILIEEENTGVTLSADGKYLAAIVRDPPRLSDTIRVWEVKSKGRVGRDIKAEGPVDPEQMLAVSAGGKYVAAVVADPAAGKSGARAQVWEVATGEVVTSVSDALGFTGLTFSPDGEYFAAGGATANPGGGTTVRIVRLADRRQLAAIKIGNSARSMAFSAHSKYLAIGTDAVTVWVRETGEVVPLVDSEDWTNTLAFSADENFLVASVEGETVYVWDIAAALKDAEHKEVAYFTPGSKIFALAITRHGDYVATIGEGNYARIWDVRRKREVASIPHRSAGENQDVVAFLGENDERLVTAHSDEPARLWLWRSDSLIKASCSRLTLRENPETLLKEYVDAQLLENMSILGNCPEQK